MSAISSGFRRARFPGVNWRPPQRHELEASQGQPVIAGARPTATRANGAAVGSGLDLCFQRGSPLHFPKPDRPVDKRLELVNPIKDSLELHPALPSLMADCVATPSSQRSGGMPYSTQFAGAFPNRTALVTHKFC